MVCNNEIFVISRVAKHIDVRNLVYSASGAGYFQALLKLEFYNVHLNTIVSTHGSSLSVFMHGKRLVM